VTRLLRAIVDTHALRSNLVVVRQRAPGARVMAVVKANAYGHGIVPVALALDGADAFAVARIEEGIALRAAGIRQPILLLEGAFGDAQLAEAAHHDFEVVVHDPTQIEALERWRGPHRFVIWIKIDTGMNRLGFRCEEFARALERVCTLEIAPLEVRVLTHLACADDLESSMTREQVARFRRLTGALGLATSIGNSAGLLPGCAENRGDWVRPGLALYGVSPFPAVPAADFGLIPVMTLQTTVLATRRVPRGETVGYGATWRAERDSQIAILAAGYGDGLPRQLADGTPVLVAGKRVPLVGRVSMDMVAVDVTGVDAVAVGSQAVLWGRELAVEEVAGYAGTIPYELLCGISQRVPVELR